MANLKFGKETIALLVIDPYNDFISEGGKIWGRIRAVAEANDCVPHMLLVLNAALRVFYALLHRYLQATTRPGSVLLRFRKRPGRIRSSKWARGGGEIRRGFEPQPRDIVALEHWCSSGFANTDLDLQLKKHGIQELIVIGLIAHTCMEAMFRFAAELGYEVAMVKDATADFSDEEIHAAVDINMPYHASGDSK